MSETLLTAFVGGGFSVLVAFIEVMRRQNNRDHGTNAAKLDHIAEQQRETHRGIERVEHKIHEHITDHAKGIV